VGCSAGYCWAAWQAATGLRGQVSQVRFFPSFLFLFYLLIFVFYFEFGFEFNSVCRNL
jgi:hypothetical protein